ncbi:DNA primase [Candidatus Babeliales bacterium]|nr:DNA primase [Candidatus Babeliales bacterium]
MNIFSYVKSQLSIVDVIHEYTTLKKAGTYLKGACPFHSERTGSFTVSPHKEIFYCFGCQASGDVIAFIARAENCSQIEAVHHLVDRYNLELPESITFDAKQEAERTSDKKKYFSLCEFVATWCARNLEANQKARDHLLERGFSLDTLAQFKIGYFPGGLESIRKLINFVNKDNFLTQDLIKAHIVTEGRTVLYSPFEERLIFPITDHLGRYCGFGGRVFQPNDNRARYYNSRENEYFTKGSLLFGLNLAKPHIQQQETVFLVEGYTDCLAMVQAGYHNTVATLGTACTLEHLTILSRQAHTIYVLYDGDDAGRKAMLRLAELCWKADVDLKVITLPKEHDPASFLKQGGNLRSYIARAQDIFMFFVASLGKDFKGKSLSEKLRTTQKVIDLLSSIPDTLKRDLLLQKAAQAFDIPFESLSNELKRALDKGTNAHTPPKIPLPLPQTSDVLQHVGSLEKKLFSVIMDDVRLVAAGHGRYIVRYFSDQLRSLLEKRLVKYRQNPDTSFAAFFDELGQQEQRIISQVIAEYDTEDPESAFEHLFAQFQKKHWKSIVSDIKTRLNQAEQEQDNEKITELLTTFQTLKKTLLRRGLL